MYVKCMYVCRFKEYYGMPRKHSLRYLRAFQAKRELHCLFLGKKVIIITSKQGITTFSSHYNQEPITQSFSRKTCRKIGRKARVHTERV